MVDFNNIRENIFIFNTISKKKEKFVPLEKDKIGMYVCGPTVYDDPHIGHGRAAIVFDVIYRFFKYIGFSITNVRNYTDIDDKIINRANDEGVDFLTISEKYIKSYEENMAILNNLEPDYKPKVTEHIKEIIDLIQNIIDNGHGYVVNNNVYFDVKSFKEYGKLSGRNIEELEQVSRIDNDSDKRNPLDFALWKKSKENEPFWTSPWGEGRPGWHIECSAMSTKYLGKTFDIHGGGRDLIFPHHENEIAQSEAGFKQKFVNYWVHNGHVEINKEKMSKSLKNFVSIGDAVKLIEPEAIRFFILQTHYRSPINYTFENLKISENNLLALYETKENFYNLKKELSGSGDIATFLDNKNLSSELKKIVKELLVSNDNFFQYLSDDFHTPKAVALIFDYFTEINKILVFKKIRKVSNISAVFELIDEFIKVINNTLGILHDEPKEFTSRVNLKRLKELNITEEELNLIIKERIDARKDKNWEKSDKIRDDLADKGIFLEDTPTGTKWRIQ